MNASEGLAKYDMEKRGIPAGNLVQLWVTDEEWCSREDVEEIYISSPHVSIASTASDSPSASS